MSGQLKCDSAGNSPLSRVRSSHPPLPFYLYNYVIITVLVCDTIVSASRYINISTNVILKYVLTYSTKLEIYINSRLVEVL